ncbi:MAG: caspase family protein [Gemmataceae bacterium]
MEYLHKAGPSREHLFSWRDQDRQEQAEKTTVRQRPLWVFFPTRQDQGNHWLIWRWRDYYYDSDGPEADGLAGLQRTRGDDQPPDFHPLANVGGSPVARGANLRQYHNPGKIWPYIRDSIQRGVDQRRVLFAEVEPPKVALDVVQAPTDPANPDVPRDLVVKVTVTPHGDGAAQKVARVSLWLGDYLFDLDRFARQEDPGTRAVSITATVPHRELRRGENQVRAVAANGAGGFGEATRVVEFAARREKPRLLALCVGVSDYSEVSKRSGAKVPDLRCAENDAKALHRVFLEHKDSRLFSSVIAPKPVVNQQATRQGILDQLDRLKPQARPDDWLVLYLSGHGDGVDDPVTQEKRPGSFYYVCYDTTRGQPQTGIQGPELHARLRGINCHKLILMDACHSGDSVPDMVRDLTLNEAKFLVFTACKNTEVANEPNLKLINAAIKADPKRFAYLKGLNLDHGLFTLGLLNTLGHPAEGPAQSRLRPVSADEVRLTVRTTVAEMLNALGAGRQTPVFFPNDPGQLRRLDVFCAFPRPKASP